MCALSTITSLSSQCASLWNSFMRRRFPLDCVRSGRSELLITCLCSLAPPRLVPAWTVFYEINIPPSWNLLAWHDIKRNGNSNETCFFKKKKISCHEDVIVRPKPSNCRQFPWKLHSFSSDGCHCRRGAACYNMSGLLMAWLCHN